MLIMLTHTVSACNAQAYVGVYTGTLLLTFTN